MPKNAIELHIAEHGLVNAIETLISTPEKLETTEITAAVKLRIVAQLLTVSDEAIESLATCMDALEALQRPREQALAAKETGAQHDGREV